VNKDWTIVVHLKPRDFYDIEKKILMCVKLKCVHNKI